jgi:hypothetical protein
MAKRKASKKKQTKKDQPPDSGDQEADDGKVQTTLDGDILQQPTHLDQQMHPVSGKSEVKTPTKTPGKGEVKTPIGSKAPSVEDRLDALGFMRQLPESKSGRSVPMYQKCFLKNQTIIM